MRERLAAWQRTKASIIPACMGKVVCVDAAILQLWYVVARIATLLLQQTDSQQQDIHQQH
jgi:hypothetical protein